MLGWFLRPRTWRYDVERMINLISDHLVSIEARIRRIELATGRVTPEPKRIGPFVSQIQLNAVAVECLRTSSLYQCRKILTDLLESAGVSVGNVE